MPDLTISTLTTSLSGIGSGNASGVEDTSSGNPGSFQSILSGQLAATDKSENKSNISPPATPKPQETQTVEKTASEKDGKSKTTNDNTTDATSSTPTTILVPPVTLPPPVSDVQKSASLNEELATSIDSKSLNNSPVPATIASADDLTTKATSASNIQTSGASQDRKIATQEQFKIPDKELYAEIPPASDLKSANENMQSTNSDVLNAMLTSQSTSTTPLNASVKNTEATTFTLQSKVGSQSWTGELANRVTFMVGEKIQTAEIHLNPENLGPINVRIEVQKDQQTTITFNAIHPETRVALENAMTQLRDMLSSNGISASGFSVSSDAFSGGFQQNAGSRQQSGQRSSNNDSTTTTSIITRSIGTDGIVDTFA